MTEDASERLRRLLSVLPLFADGECVSHERLEQVIGVNVSSLLEDLRAVSERPDSPGGFVEDLRVEFESGRVAVHSSHFKRPMRITIPELCALELGLAMLAAGMPPDERDPILRARAKVRHAIVNTPVPLRDDVWHAAGPDIGDNTILAALHSAAIISTKVRITYRAGSATAATSRVIHPYALLPAHGTYYVVAHCEQSEGLRFFRVDRMEAADAIAGTFTRPEHLPIDEFLERGKAFHGQPAEALVIRYSPQIARWIAEREGRGLAPDGSLTVEHPLADDQWAVGHVLQYGAEAEVLAPARMRELVKKALQRMLS